MLINADFTRCATKAPEEYRWLASPQNGVERVILDRIGEEKARATSIVRYAPASYFPSHQHPGGEEILVLSGTFSDEGGDYPAGWYLRNPPDSSHKPFSADGCIIFVKLRQMKADENRQVRINTRTPSNWERLDGRETCGLYSGSGETVCLQRILPGEGLFSTSVESAELLVLEGNVLFGKQSFATGGWIRLPEGSYPEIVAGPQGATIYLKTLQKI